VYSHFGQRPGIVLLAFHTCVECNDKRLDTRRPSLDAVWKKRREGERTAKSTRAERTGDSERYRWLENQARPNHLVAVTAARDTAVRNIDLSSSLDPSRLRPIQPPPRASHRK
jgi:hypothetical protein